MKNNLSFKSHYMVEVLEELGTENRYYYPRASTNGGNDGLTIKVISPNGESWIGIFEFGKISGNGISGIFTTPNTDIICIVAKGAGYMVSTSNPLNWEQVKSIPIMDVRPIKSHNLLIFADYTELVAYNDTGIKWRTERLAYDNLKIIEITEDFIKGEYWNISNDSNDTFKVNIETGEQIGGSTDIYL